MKEREELELILKLIGKYNLPLSPILEYAVKEKMEAYPETSTTSSDVASESTSTTVAVEAPTLFSNYEESSDYNAEQSSDSMEVESTEERKVIINKEETSKFDKSDFTIKNTLTRCFIINKLGEKVFSTQGRLIYINGNLYLLNVKAECFTLRSMKYKGGLWKNGKEKIVALPNTELFDMMDYSLDYAYEIEDIIDNSVIDNCRLKVGGFWFNNKGNLTLGYSD